MQTHSSCRRTPKGNRTTHALTTHSIDSSRDRGPHTKTNLGVGGLGVDSKWSQCSNTASLHSVRGDVIRSAFSRSDHALKWGLNSPPPPLLCMRMENGPQVARNTSHGYGAGITQPRALLWRIPIGSWVHQSRSPPKDKRRTSCLKEDHVSRSPLEV